MSKFATPATTPTVTPAGTIPQEKIAMRAYEKWCQRGRPCGTEQQDWYEAETELRNEYARQTGANTFRR